MNSDNGVKSELPTGFSIMPSPNLEISEEQEGEITIVSISGPIDSVTFDEFKEAIHRYCNSPGARVLLDCEHLSYMNSKSLGVLAQYHRKTMSTMGFLGLCNLSNKITKTMDLLGLGRALKIFETRDEALSVIQSAK